MFQIILCSLVAAVTLMYALYIGIASATRLWEYGPNSTKSAVNPTAAIALSVFSVLTILSFLTIAKNPSRESSVNWFLSNMESIEVHGDHRDKYQEVRIILESGEEYIIDEVSYKDCRH